MSTTDSKKKRKRLDAKHYCIQCNLPLVDQYWQLEDETACNTCVLHWRLHSYDSESSLADQTWHSTFSLMDTKRWDTAILYDKDGNTNLRKASFSYPDMKKRIGYPRLPLFDKTESIELSSDCKDERINEFVVCKACGKCDTLENIAEHENCEKILEDDVMKDVLQIFEKYQLYARKKIYGILDKI